MRHAPPPGVVRTTRSVLSALALLAATASAASAESVRELWYVVLLDDHRAGWMVARETRDDERWINETTASLSLGRGETTIQVLIDYRFVETAEGKPISARSRVKSSEVTQITQWRFADDALYTRHQTLGEPVTRKRPIPAQPWLTPGQAARRTEARRRRTRA